MSIFKRKNLVVGVTTCALFVSTGCLQNLANSNFSPKSSFNSKQINSESDGIVALKEVFDSSVEKIPTLSAVGYAVVSSQPGRTDAQKRLMAIRSARMAAMRELAEQIRNVLDPLASRYGMDVLSVYGVNHSWGPNLDWKVVWISISLKFSFISLVVLWQ